MTLFFIFPHTSDLVLVGRRYSIYFNVLLRNLCWHNRISMKETDFQLFPSGPSPPGTSMVILLPFNRIWSSLVTLLPSLVISYSVTSSNTMLTKSSKPRRVPTTSLSFFIIMCILEPIALSTSSNGNKLLGVDIVRIILGQVWNLKDCNASYCTGLNFVRVNLFGYKFMGKKTLFINIITIYTLIHFSW